MSDFFDNFTSNSTNKPAYSKPTGDQKQGFEKQREIRFIKGNPAGGKATCLIMKRTNTGEIIFQAAKQIGTIENGGKVLPKFDYETKLFFTLNEIEAARIVLTLDRLFFNPQEIELKFPHMVGKEPKNINFKFSLYQGKIQCGLNIYVPSNTAKNFSVYLDENELEVLKLNLIKTIQI
ncbi:MAG: hypothetical protein ACRCW9_09785 [Cetobacterium sp.]